MVNTKMKPTEAYEYASSWGSLVRNGDPGACMYGFQSDCRPQSEEHRKSVLEYMNGCRMYVVGNPTQYDNDEIEKMDAFLEFIKERAIDGQERESFIIEISSCGSVNACKLDGEAIDGDLLNDLMDCTGSGDVEGPCQYVLDQYKPQIRTVKQINGEYQNVLADAEDKAAVCREIVCDSDTDFTDEDNANLYIVWEAAHSVEREQDEQDEQDEE